MEVAELLAVLRKWFYYFQALEKQSNKTGWKCHDPVIVTHVVTSTRWFIFKGLELKRLRAANLLI